MKKFLAVLTVILLLFACKQESQKETITVKQYSGAVKDTFSLFIQLPQNYNAKAAVRYPVVYLLDANFHFDIMAGVFKKYAEVGLLPPAILVGIGYKDFRTLDSLRNRDLTYPAAMPEYRMSQSGKADKFLTFITSQVMPYIESNYSADKHIRVLMGHALSGYFTLYALQQDFVSKGHAFSSYIAASPSLDYNHHYLVYEFEKLAPEDRADTKVYITYGGLEDAEEAGEGNSDSTRLSSEEALAWAKAAIRTQGNVHCRGDMYSNLGHMDTPLPSFVRGLQWALNMTE